MPCYWNMPRLTQGYHRKRLVKHLILLVAGYRVFSTPQRGQRGSQVARPHKQTVDYFPHDTDASDGKTLTIIQSKYGNDGYAFWFKLLQLLGKTSGHYYDFNNPADWEFLLAKTHQNDTETTKAILNMLAVMGAIDTELYAQNIIWCQKFVDRIADAYDRTVDGVPSKPQPKESLRQLAERLEVSESYLSQVTTGDRLASDKLLKKCLSLGIDIKGVNVSNQGVSVDINSAYSAETPENITETPQTKLKETKREERGGELSAAQQYLFNILL